MKVKSQLGALKIKKASNFAIRGFTDFKLKSKNYFFFFLAAFFFVFFLAAFFFLAIDASYDALVIVVTIVVSNAFSLLI
jgi:hypothetical protein